MGTPDSTHRRYRFGEFVLDVDRGALLTGGAGVKLRPQSFSVLRHLVEHHGRLVSRDDLLEAVWGNTVVTDCSLRQCLIDVRRAIGDHSRQLIRTQPRRGYIFEAPVEVIDAGSAAAPAPSGRSFARRPRAVACVFALVFAAATAWWVLRSGAPDERRAAARPNSIAVLPFVDMSKGQDRGYFSDGISEKILDQATAIDPEAYQHYLQGRFFHNRRAPGDSERAERHYRQALEIDPAYAPAWAGLAGAYVVQIVQERSAIESKWADWGEAVEQALSHGPELAEAHVRAGQYFRHTERPERAAEHRRKALLLAPDDPLVLSSAAGANVLRGRLDLAIEQYRRAIDVDPLSTVLHINFAHMLAGAGLFEEALTEEQKALDLNPLYGADFNLSVGFVFIAQRRLDEGLAVVREWPEGADRDAGIAMIYGALGRQSEADAALDRLIERPGPKPALRVAEVHAWRGATEESFMWLEKGRALGRRDALPERGDWMHEARLSPFLIPLRDDQRWEQLLAWEE